jgi:hypothetical protein
MIQNCFGPLRRIGHQNIFPQFRSPEEIQPDLTVQSASSSSRQQSTARLTRFPSDLLETSVDPQPAAQAAAQQVNWAQHVRKTSSPSLNTKFCIKGLLVVRYFCFLAVLTLLKKSPGPILSNSSGRFFHVFRGKKC